MSPTLEEIRRTAEQRLQALAPALEEARQLQDLIATLDAAAERGGARGRATADREPFASARAARRGRAPQGSNKRLILGIVAEQPGIAAPEIARRTGMKRTVVASTISRLKRTGELAPCGEGVQLARDRAPA
jgi:hypothetical protein